MLKFKLTVGILFACTVHSFCQTSEEHPTEAVNAKKTTEIYPQPAKEPMLSLEEQGFTKFVENNKVIYRKTVNGITVEYTPAP